MRRARPLAPLLVAATAALAALAGGAAPAVLAQSPPPPIAIGASGGSGVAGTATLADLGGGRTRVEVRLAPAGGDHPMHVHEGPCASPNPAPRYALANVQNGASTTEVGVALTDLSRSPMSINVRRSAQAMDTVVACGDLLPAAAGVSVLPGGGAPDAGGGPGAARSPRRPGAARPGRRGPRRAAALPPWRLTAPGPPAAAAAAAAATRGRPGVRASPPSATC